METYNCNLVFPTDTQFVYKMWGKFHTKYGGLIISSPTGSAGQNNKNKYLMLSLKTFSGLHDSSEVRFDQTLSSLSASHGAPGQPHSQQCGRRRHRAGQGEDSLPRGRESD